jgi:ribosomal protein S18
MAQNQSEIRYLTPPSVEIKKKKYCRFKKNKIKYIDYKDGEFLKKFLNEQGKIYGNRYKDIVKGIITNKFLKQTSKNNLKEIFKF